jgi:hypothetical protein
MLLSKSNGLPVMLLGRHMPKSNTLPQWMDIAKPWESSTQKICLQAKRRKIQKGSRFQPMLAK